MGKIKDIIKGRKFLKDSKEYIKNLIEKVPKDRTIAYENVMLEIDINIIKLQKSLTKQHIKEDHELLEKSLKLFEQLKEAIIDAGGDKKKSFKVLKILREMAKMKKFDDRIEGLVDG